MGKLIVTEFVSLDGVMEAPGGEPGYAHSGWVGDYMAEETLEFKLDETLESDSLLLGRVTYEGFFGAWPERDGPFADKMNAMPKHVVTTTLTDDDLEWENSSVLAGGVSQGVAALKEAGSGPILVAGSCTLVHSLIENRLVDEFRLMIFPVILGSGLKVFPDTPERTNLKLTQTQAFPTGVQVHTYEPE